MNNSLIKGAITILILQESIEMLSKLNNIGVHSSFMGQIRADEVDGKQVAAIDYSAYEPMAIKVIEDIKVRAMSKFDLSIIFIFHSMGIVKVGEASLLVIAASKHRRPSLEGLDWIVEAIKKEVPVFGKEVFEDGEYQWKVNV